MDPALNPLYFKLDYALLAEVFAALLFLSFAIERALSVVFESPYYDRLQGLGLKSVIATAVSLASCWYLHFDLFAIVFHQEQTTVLGYVLTALVIAGGSKGVMALMRQVFRIPNYVDRLEGKSAVHLPKDFRKPGGAGGPAIGGS